MLPLPAVRVVLPTLLLLGCGYGLIRADGGPVDSIHLGVLHDLSAEGDLGLVATRAIRRTLGHRLSSEGPTLSGELWAMEDSVIASDGAGLMYRVGVRLEIQITSAAGRALWRNRSATRHDVYVRGPTPFDSREARRRALHRAVEAATEEVVAQFLATPRIT